MKSMGRGMVWAAVLVFGAAAAVFGVTAVDAFRVQPMPEPRQEVGEEVAGQGDLGAGSLRLAVSGNGERKIGIEDRLIPSGDGEIGVDITQG